MANVVQKFCNVCEEEREGVMVDNIDMRCGSCGNVVCATPHMGEDGEAIERVPAR